jgi:hypothetical protein
MGRPNEGRLTEVARERKIRAYQPWHVMGDVVDSVEYS